MNESEDDLTKKISKIEDNINLYFSKINLSKEDKNEYIKEKKKSIVFSIEIKKELIIKYKNRLDIIKRIYNRSYSIGDKVIYYYIMFSRETKTGIIRTIYNNIIVLRDNTQIRSVQLKDVIKSIDFDKTILFQETNSILEKYQNDIIKLEKDLAAIDG